MKLDLRGIAAGLVFLSLVGCASNEQLIEQTKKSEPVARVSASELVTEYQANEVAADLKYKDKVIAVQGEVWAIQKDLGGNPVVILTPGKGHGIVTVSCTYGKDAIEKTAMLKKGQTAKLKGVCAGKLGAVHMKGCVPL